MNRLKSNCSANSSVYKLLMIHCLLLLFAMTMHRFHAPSSCLKSPKQVMRTFDIRNHKPPVLLWRGYATAIMALTLDMAQTSLCPGGDIGYMCYENPEETKRRRSHTKRASRLRHSTVALRVDLRLPSHFLKEVRRLPVGKRTSEELSRLVCFTVPSVDWTTDTSGSCWFVSPCLAYSQKRSSTTHPGFMTVSHISGSTISPVGLRMS